MGDENYDGTGCQWPVCSSKGVEVRSNRRFCAHHLQMHLDRVDPKVYLWLKSNGEEPRMMPEAMSMKEAIGAKYVALSGGYAHLASITRSDESPGEMLPLEK